MAETMKAAVVHEFGAPLTIDETPVPEPGHGEVLVRVDACGVCHSDVHAVDGDWPGKPELPLIPGHEAAGTVAAAGPGVKFLREGDRVGVPWINRTCGVCDCCLTGKENFCRHQKSTGYMVNGGFADYVIAGAEYVGRLPDSLDAAVAAPILCAGITSYRAVKESNVGAGEWIAVSGAGGLGHLAIEYAKFMGMYVLAVDVSDDKLALAKKVGADITLNAADADGLKGFRKETGGAHGVVVTATAEAAYIQATRLLRQCGTLIMVAMPAGELRLPIVPTIARGVTVKGSAVGNRKDLREVLELAAANKVTADITTRPFDDVNDVINGLREGSITGRVVLKIN